jgi:hypothetical protein
MQAMTRIKKMRSQLDALTGQVGRVQGRREVLSELSRHLDETTSGAAAGVPTAKVSSLATDASSGHGVTTQGPASRPLAQEPFDTGSSLKAVLSTTKILRDAGQARAHAAALLKAVDRPTDVRTLDALDQKIAAVSVALEGITRAPTR